MNHNAGAGRSDRHMFCRHSALLDRFNLFRRKSPKAQLFPRRGNGFFRCIPQILAIRIRQFLLGLNGLNQLLLRRKQFGAVEFGEMVAFFDRNASVVHIEAINPPRHPRGNIRNPRFIIRHRSHHRHLGGNKSPLHRCGFQFHKLSGIGADAHFALPFHLPGIRFQWN